VQIQPEFIINVDETPLFYEYLPKRTVEKKDTRDVKTWKTGRDKKLRTLILAITKTGLVLKPSLILPRKTRYELELRNRLGMKVYRTTSANVWMNSPTMILWLQEVLKLYVGDNQILLLLGNFSPHYSKDVRDVIKDTNINLV